MKKPILPKSYDLKNFFDFENLKDYIVSVCYLGVRGKTYWLLYRMREEMNINVKTPVQMSESEEANDVIMQGGVYASLKIFQYSYRGQRII